jgi:hypothetical protein
MTARKAMTMTRLFTAMVAWLWPQGRERVSEGKPDPAASARIRAYMALTMVERYGEHGPP